MQPLAGTPPLDSQEFWSRPYSVPISGDSDTDTATSIRIMCEDARQSAQDQGVRETAAAAVAQLGNLSGDMDDAARIAAGAWWYCKLFVKFVHHESIIRQRLGQAGHLQGLISPAVLIRMDRPEGDCAIFSSCIAAFLQALGVPFEFVTVAVNPSEPSVYSHVFLYAVMPDGRRIPLDASHGDYPGWQVPSAHVTRRQVWDASGNPVQDRGSRFDGLHNYTMRSGLGSMVYDSQTDSYYDDGAGGVTDPNASTLPYYPLPTGGGTYVDQITGKPYGGPAYQVPAQNSPQWAPFASSLAKMGFDLAKLQSIPQGTIIKPDGTILRQNPGYSVPTLQAGLPGGSAFNLGAGGSNLLLYGGLAVLGLLAISSMKGGR